MSECMERGCHNPASYNFVDGRPDPICWQCVQAYESRGVFMRLLPIVPEFDPFTIGLLLR